MTVGGASPKRVTLAELALLPFWVAWRLALRKNGDLKPAKLPYNPSTGRLAMANKPATWGTREAAEKLALLMPRPFGIGGIGLEFTGLSDGRYTAGVDLDSCRVDATGEIAPWAQSVIDRFASYAEVSPSGTGVKVFFLVAGADLPELRGALGKTVEGKDKHSRLWAQQSDGDHPPAIELHLSNRYFAVTDRILPGNTDELREIPKEDLLRLVQVDGPALVEARAPPNPTADDEEADAAISAQQQPPKRTKIGNLDRSRSQAAFVIGIRVRRAGNTYEAMCKAIRDDATTRDWYVEKGVANGERELHRIWDKADPTTGDLILTASAPLVSARLFLVRHHMSDNIRTLRHQNDAFYRWQGSHYVERAPEEMRAALYRFLDGAQTYNDKEELVPFNPTKHKVANVLEATAAEAQLSRLVRAPSWLEEGNPPAGEIISCKNVLLHLPTGDHRTHTPAFFTLNALAFDYLANPPAPTAWLVFLASIWPNDAESIGTLQELFGLCLTADTSHQKAFLIVGPKRSGKGTIARVLTELLGSANVCSPTLGSLGTNFGLSPLLGKRLAIISDARLSGKADQAVIAERLLSITGEDAQTIDRKYREAWTGKLDARFLVLTNELPRLTDSSGALASRFIILKMVRTFYGQEDRGLLQKLIPELPGILAWAIEGWKRLTMRGHFVPPSSSAAAVREMEDLGSPIGAFLNECCNVEPDATATPNALYAAWRIWCQEHGRDHPGTTQTFGRDLGAAIPGLLLSQRRLEGGGRERFYKGVGLSEEASVSRDVTRDDVLFNQLNAYFSNDPGPS